MDWQLSPASCAREPSARTCFGEKRVARFARERRGGSCEEVLDNEPYATLRDDGMKIRPEPHDCMHHKSKNEK